MKTDTIHHAGETYPAVWLRAIVKASMNPDVFIAQIQGVPDTIEAPVFYMSPATVRTERKLSPGEQGEGQVEALLFGESDDLLTIQVLGEPVSYGPSLRVPKTLAT